MQELVSIFVYHHLRKKQVKPKNSSVAYHYVILIEWTFYYFVICKCMSTIVRVNGTVQFTFFLVMRLNITIVIRLRPEPFFMIG